MLHQHSHNNERVKPVTVVRTYCGARTVVVQRIRCARIC